LRDSGHPENIHEKIGKSITNIVEVVLEEDSEERVILIPEDLACELENYPLAGVFFNKLSYTH